MAEGKEVYKSEEKQVRYAIVRVDDTCPSGHDGCKVNLVCVQDRKRIKVTERNCKNCLYGDTKEQLIAKVQQALFKSIFTEQLQKAVAIEEQKRIYKQYRSMAEKVVEFLGVE